MINTILPLGPPTYAEDSGDEEISGIAGLRVQVEARSTLLIRLGIPVQIRILVDRADWDHATAVALCGVPAEYVLWQRHPDCWTQRERQLDANHGWLRDFGNGNQLVSGMLRRIHALSGPNTEYWHLWADQHLKIYWHGGVPHQTAVNRLTNSRTGLELMPGPYSQCRCLDDDGTETGNCGLVTLHHSSGMKLLLKRNPWR